MKDERVFGFVYRFGKNDYQISLLELSDEDEQKIQEIWMKYENDCTGIRGDKSLTLEDANCEYFEH